LLQEKVFPASTGVAVMTADGAVSGAVEAMRLHAPEGLPDLSLHLSLGASAGMQFRLESSTNLTDWESEVSLTAEAEAHSYIEVEAGKHPQRFFCIVPEFGDMEDEE
jgi:hypothetical protein